MPDRPTWAARLRTAGLWLAAAAVIVAQLLDRFADQATFRTVLLAVAAALALPTGLRLLWMLQPGETPPPPRQAQRTR